MKHDTVLTLNNGLALPYYSENRHRPPQRARLCTAASATELLQHARQSCATVWQGDFYQGKTLLDAVKKRLRRPTAPQHTFPDNPREWFHRHRLRQSQQSRDINMLLLEIHPDFTLRLPRAPDVSAALADALDAEWADQHFLMPFNLLLGMMGAYQWHQKGVDLPALGGRVHVPFGVFSPVRGEYLHLLQHAPLPPSCQQAFDIGTGSGVIALLLAQRGIAHITATDTNRRALACARANVQRFGLGAQIDVLEQDLFPAARADLIVCNPPWLPAQPTSTIETALYDPDHAMLRAFLHAAPQHLNPDGEVWLILSDLAEHLGLRAADALPQWFEQAGLRLIATEHTHPVHPKSADRNDPLAFARRRERTFLYRLSHAR